MRFLFNLALLGVLTFGSAAAVAYSADFVVTRVVPAIQNLF
jgi:hypothetical protein